MPNIELDDLVFVGGYFYPDFSAGSQMLSDLSFFFAKKGVKVSVVTSRKMYNRSDRSLSSYESFNNVNIYRTWSTSFGKSSLIGRATDYLSLEISLIVCLFHVVKKKNIVVVMTDPPLLNVVALPIVNFKGGKVVNWLQDLFPEVAVGAGVFSEKTFINKLLLKLRNKCTNGSVMNIAIGNKMYGYLRSINGRLDNIVMIPNWSDGQAIKPIPNSDNYLGKEWGLEGKFVIGYSGNLGHAHNVETILKAVEILKDCKDVVFLFIGGGVGMKSIKHQFEEKNIYNVCFKPYQPRNLLSLSLGVSDIHWATLEPVMEGFIVPSKFYGILAAGRPIIFIGDKSGEIAIEVEKIGCGVNIGVSDYMGFVKIIWELLNNNSLLQEMGVRARSAFELEYDFPVSALKFQKLFEKIGRDGV